MNNYFELLHDFLNNTNIILTLINKILTKTNKTINTNIPIVTDAGIPVGNEFAVWITVPSPTEEYAPTLTTFISPLITTLYQIEAYAPTNTSPTKFYLSI